MAFEGITPRNLDSNYFSNPATPFQDQDEDPNFPIPRSIKKRIAKELEKRLKEELTI